MSMSINNLTFTGRVGAVFSIKKFSNGAMLEFTVAVRSNFKNKNGDYDVQWFYCKVWDKPECNYINMLSSQLAKGVAVTCSGTLEFDPATGGPKLFTGTDGVWKAVFGVNIKDVVVQLPKSGGNGAGSAPKAAAKEAAAREEQFEEIDDVPW